jgi:hypothetical protein
MRRIAFAILTLAVLVAQGETRPLRGRAPISSTSRVRQPGYVAALRAELERTGAERVKSVYSHQIKAPEHRAHWEAQYRRHGNSMLGKWIGAGRYPGIWTLEGKSSTSNWYGKTGGKPVKFKLKNNALFIDLDEPTQRAVYDKWKQCSGANAGDPKDMFQRIKDAQGYPLSKKIPGIRAPSHGRFLEELNIAGLVWYDTYGRRCPVLLNPGAIKSVQF